MEQSPAGRRGPGPGGPGQLFGEGRGEQNLCWEQFSATGGDWVGTCTVNFGLLRQAELLQVNSPLHTTQDILDPNRGELSHSHQRTLGSPLPHPLLQQLLSQTPTP